MFHRCFIDHPQSFSRHQRLAPGLGAQRNMQELVNNGYAAVGRLLENVGQTCGVHVSSRCRLNPPTVLTRRPGRAVVCLKQPLVCLPAACVLFMICRETQHHCCHRGNEKTGRISQPAHYRGKLTHTSEAEADQISTETIQIIY